MKQTVLNTRCAKLIPFLLLVMFASGCTAVVSKRQVGEKAASLKANDWEGVWITSDGTAKVKVVDANKGLLKVFWLDDEQGKTEMKTADVELRQSGDWLFANTKDEKGRGYVWGRIKNEDRQIILWIPDAEKFKQLVEGGTFHGKIENDGLILEELTSQDVNLITSGKQGILFQWDKPVVFVKTGN